MDPSLNSIAPTLPEQLLHWARTRGDAVALRQKEFGVWRPVTWREYADRARRFGLGLRQLGLERGQCLAVLSENRLEWVYAELGAAMVGVVAAGVYPTSPAAEVQYLLDLCEAPVIVVEDQEQLDKVLAIRSSLGKLRAIIVIDDRGLRNYDRTGLHTFADVHALGERCEREQAAWAQEATRAPEPDDVGLIIFTSGSTGRPKAAMMTWRGLTSANVGLNSLVRCGPGDNLVSYLPLCHMAEQMFSVHIPVAAGGTVNFAESLRTVQEDVREMAPEFFFGVPRIWEKLHSSIQTRVREAGGIRQRVYDFAMSRLERQAATLRADWSVSQRLMWGLCYLMVVRSLLNFIGLRRCRIAVSAGAPIAPDILRFFRKIGVPIREAYGMTECSGAITIQPADDSPAGSVGIGYAGVEVAIADDGEILVRGPILFKGYYANEEATAQAIDEQRWLHTGDVGCWIDGPQGRELKVIDRKKDIMITAGGKNITPSEIENALRFSPYVKEAIVIADRRRFVSALLQIDYDSVSKWAEGQGLTYTTFRSLVEHERVRGLIQSEVDAVNAKMPRVQQVRTFYLLPKELDHDDGEVTATMKVRRRSISEKYADVIEEMYA